jgi:UDP-N-acetylglucosamine acyltransferase
MISNLAYVHPKAKLAENVTVEPFAYISQDVEIGEGTWIGPHATIFDGAKIGKNCKIFSGSIVSGIPQDLKFNGEESTAEIGENTIIREGVTINRGTAALGKTVIGSNCLLMAYSHVAHDCRVGNNCILGNVAGLAGEVKVDDWVIISGGTFVHQFSHIGSHVIVGPICKVRMNVPPFIKAERDPLSYMGLNTVGLVRRGFTKERIDAIHDIYRIIYQSGMNVSQALDRIEKEISSSPDRDYIIEFIRKSERGIIRGRK